MGEAATLLWWRDLFVCVCVALECGDLDGKASTLYALRVPDCPAAHTQTARGFPNLFSSLPLEVVH